MENETVFYVLGGALVVVALVLSAIGLRWEGFPGARGMQLAVSLGVAVLVVATAAFAWRSAEDEQAHREAELAHEAEESAEEGEDAEALEQQGGEAPEATTTTEDTTTAGVDGAEVYAANGCGGCHQLADAQSEGTTGPPLDASLRGKSAGYVETAIVDPNQQIAGGYPPDVMPQTYEQQLSPEELDALVRYLVDATGGKG